VPDSLVLEGLTSSVYSYLVVGKSLERFRLKTDKSISFYLFNHFTVLGQLVLSHG
jgi:hypothetical protein